MSPGRDDRDGVDEGEALPALVDAARRGSGGAMDTLFRRFAPVVHGVLMGYVQKADADDLTQDVFETAMQRLGQLREAAAFPGWLLGIARHAARLTWLTLSHASRSSCFMRASMPVPAAG